VQQLLIYPLAPCHPKGSQQGWWASHTSIHDFSFIFSCLWPLRKHLSQTFQYVPQNRLELIFILQDLHEDLILLTLQFWVESRPWNVGVKS
jgi:hypothetical protein